MAVTNVKFASPLTYEVGKTGTVVAFANDGGLPVTGLATMVCVVVNSSGQFWNGAAWQATLASVAMTETDTTNLPGCYHVSLPFTTSALCPVGNEEDFFIRVLDTGTFYMDVVGISVRKGLNTLVVEDGVVPTPTAAADLTLPQLLTALMVFVRNNQKLDDITKTQIFYKADGTTPAMVFDCKNGTGLSSIDEVFAKERS